MPGKVAKIGNFSEWVGVFNEIGDIDAEVRTVVSPA